MAEATRDIDIRSSSVALWYGNLAPPIAWAAALQLRYALVHWACASGARWTLTACAAPLFVLALSGAFIGWRYKNDSAARIRFMATGALALGLIFALTIAAGTIPDLFLSPCD